MQKITIKQHFGMGHWDYWEAESFRFPGGEIQVRIPGLPETLNDVVVEAGIQSSEDFVQLLLVDEILHHQCSVAGAKVLILPYMPYARQDRMMDRTEAFSLKPITYILNSTGFTNITIVDPHSPVTPALLYNTTVIEQDEVMDYHRELVEFIGANNPVLISPDAGASKKTLKAAMRFGLDMVQATKVRDTRTGEITATRVEEVEKIEGRHALIVDDICDGGRTFLELGKVIRPHVLTSNLYVTHGIFSKGLAPIHTIDRFFTTDSFASDVRSTLAPSQTLHVQNLNFNSIGRLA